jgi:hypothetical protein
VPPTLTSTLAVSPDAVVYVVVPRRRPRAGEPHHAFPGRLPCAGEVAAIGQACRATAARYAAVVRSRRTTRCAGRPSWAAPWAACAVPAEAELGSAPAWSWAARVLCRWAEPTS